jgi:UDPglucose 6-dehydrogenase
MGRKVIAACGGSVRGKKIAVLGLTFKPNTDDMRDAPSITIVQALLDGGADVHVFDPEGMDAAKSMLGPVVYGKNPYEVSAGAEAIVVVTEWDEFRALDFRRLKTEMTVPVIVDLRNIYKSEEMAKYGFAHFPIGKRKAKA